MPRELALIKGIPELEAALAKKVEELRASNMAAVAEEVRNIEADARERAPRDTGELQDDIVSRAEGLEGTVRSTSRHSIFVEFGTFKDSAQPFMKPAAEKARRRFPARAAAIIKTALGG